MSLPPIQQIRSDVAMRIAAHLQARQFGLPNAYAFAKDTVKKWSDQRCTLVYLLSNHENQFISLRQLARMMGTTLESTSMLWHGLRKTHVTLPGNAKVLLFRGDTDMRIRLNKRVDGVLVKGGVCLHLSCHDGMTYAQERTISESLLESAKTIAEAHNGSANRQAGMAEVPAEQAARSAARAHVIIKGASGPQLALPVPMASNDGE
jgi:hypothetical protein